MRARPSTVQCKRLVCCEIAGILRAFQAAAHLQAQHPTKQCHNDRSNKVDTTSPFYARNSKW
jgi:hypothetical protein